MQVLFAVSWLQIFFCPMVDMIATSESFTGWSPFDGIYMFITCMRNWN